MDTIIITDIDMAAAVLGELHSHHRHTRNPVTLPAPELAAWALSRDVTPSGSGGAARAVEGL